MDTGLQKIRDDLTNYFTGVWICENPYSKALQKFDKIIVDTTVGFRICYYKAGELIKCSVTHQIPQFDGGILYFKTDNEVFYTHFANNSQMLLSEKGKKVSPNGEIAPVWQEVFEKIRSNNGDYFLQQIRAFFSGTFEREIDTPALKRKEILSIGNKKVTVKIYENGGFIDELTYEFEVPMFLREKDAPWNIYLNGKNNPSPSLCVFWVDEHLIDVGIFTNGKNNENFNARWIYRRVK